MGSKSNLAEAQAKVLRLEAEVAQLTGWLDAEEQDTLEYQELLDEQLDMLTAALEFMWKINYDPMKDIRALLAECVADSTVVSRAKLQTLVDNFNIVRES